LPGHDDIRRKLSKKNADQLGSAFLRLLFLFTVYRLLFTVYSAVTAFCLCLYHRRHSVPGLLRLVALANDPACHVPGLAAVVAQRVVVTVPRAVAAALPEVAVARVAHLLDPAALLLLEHLAGRAAFAVEQLAAAAHPGVVAVHVRAEDLAVHAEPVVVRGVLPLLPARAE
jgi:hypothetical protein